MNFEFATATRIVFGAGKLAELGIIVRGFGRRALVVSGARPTAAERVTGLLQAANVTAVRFAVVAEPTVAIIEQGTKLAREASCEFVIANRWRQCD